MAENAKREGDKTSLWQLLLVRCNNITSMLGENTIIYEENGTNVEFRTDVENQTIWAPIQQMAQLFGVQKSAISKHLTNIYDSGELIEEATVSKMETVQLEGKRSIKRAVEFYNLDAIIAVGYRVSSKKATKFRIWATRILRQYLIRGHGFGSYDIEIPESLEGLHQALALIESKAYKGKLKGKITIRLTKDLVKSE